MPWTRLEKRQLGGRYHLHLSGLCRWQIQIYDQDGRKPHRNDVAATPQSDENLARCLAAPPTGHGLSKRIRYLTRRFKSFGCSCRGSRFGEVWIKLGGLLCLPSWFRNRNV